MQKLTKYLATQMPYAQLEPERLLTFGGGSEHSSIRYDTQQSEEPFDAYEARAKLQMKPQRNKSETELNSRNQGFHFKTTGKPINIQEDAQIMAGDKSGSSLPYVSSAETTKQGNLLSRNKKNASQDVLKKHSTFRKKRVSKQSNDDQSSSSSALHIDAETLDQLKKKDRIVTLEDDIYDVYQDKQANKSLKNEGRARNYWPILVMRRDFANQLQQKTCKQYMA